MGRISARTEQINKLLIACKCRLAPLRALSANGKGATPTVLRLMYISYIRSVIDYAAPYLASFPKTRIQKLEVLQNEALRIILNCPRTASVKLLQHELNIPSISTRITYLGVVATIRAYRGSFEGEPYIRDIRMSPQATMVSAWARTMSCNIQRLGLRPELFRTNDYKTSPVVPWDRVPPDIRIIKPFAKKSDVPDQLLQAHYLSEIYKLPHGDRIYTDGSVKEDGRAGAACVALGKTSSTIYRARLHDGASSTVAELLAILLALKHILLSSTNTVIISDSMSALQSLSSKTPEYSILANRAQRLLLKLQKKGTVVSFLWVPSHIGLLGNERADIEASRATEKENIDYNFGPSLTQLRQFIYRQMAGDSWESLQASKDTSLSTAHYLSIHSAVGRCYSSPTKSTLLLLCKVRLKLGYHYTWEFAGALDPHRVRCRVCGEPYKHTLSHYLTE